MSFGPCMCGDLACPSCGPAQGADLRMDALLSQVAETWPGLPEDDDESFWGPGGMLETCYYTGLSAEPSAITALLWVTAQGFWDGVQQKRDHEQEREMYEQSMEAKETTDG